MSASAVDSAVGVRTSGFADRNFKYLMIAPAVMVILLIGLFPVVYTLIISVQNLTMMDEDTSFHGLVHYRAVLTDLRFWEALAHTMIFVAIALPLELILGLALAYLFLERMPGRQIFVALLVLPVVTSPIIAGATWRLLFDNRFGPINQVLGWIAGEPVTILWTVDPNFVYPAILIAEVWQWTPFMFLLLFAALSNVDQSQLEAAELDGAGFWRQFRLIVLPAIWPVMAIAVLIRGLDLFRLFDVVWALTRGGPGTRTETISIYAYVKGFQQFETSFTAAMAFMVIAILAISVTLILRRMEIDR
ncbi:carbohydrate ABC transporter membrane protein 1 (CUT1 family) [Tepidamorphus gemmatus]|jgi:multiple sugar transport system permease protein|uniref:Carbohydrate ABC transporter membrane protein 1 (CUT1 family) n=1 Tax=Tepidamorphus gemmatus TaxID=747076 RepID=A0A4R3MLY0_9HYPH|nr:sugar ABC transporter permease [Tepidamorphus gemmatus]TCT13460.1 carbohydrate ABC transporter membrane protein 1 (CUT1 family) [Tepidamorphus gemmatus]